MIYENLSNAKKYAVFVPGMDKVLRAAEEYSPDSYPGGRVTIDGDEIYLNLASYETHPNQEAVLEAHRKYIDVMIMVEGTETIHVKNVERLNRVTKEYDPNLDALLAELDPDVSVVRMEPGDVLVLFPQDAHAPGCHAERPCAVKKIIGKISIR